MLLTRSEASVNIPIPLQTTGPGGIRYGTLIPSNVREGGRGGRCSDGGAQHTRRIRQTYHLRDTGQRHRGSSPDSAGANSKPHKRRWM
jgi:hypothetical protein